jgi:hypothetical protein
MVLLNCSPELATAHISKVFSERLPLAGKVFESDIYKSLFHLTLRSLGDLDS